MTNEVSYTDLSGEIRQWYGFRPLSEVIDNREELLHPSDSLRGPTELM